MYNQDIGDDSGGEATTVSNLQYARSRLQSHVH